MVKIPSQFDVRMEYIIIITNYHITMERTIKRNLKGAHSVFFCHFSNISSIDNLFSEHFTNNFIQGYFPVIIEVGAHRLFTNKGTVYAKFLFSGKNNRIKFRFLFSKNL